MNWRNYCIVKFDTNEFAIRKGWFTYKYLDLNNTRFWWKYSDLFFEESLTKEENKLRIILNGLINKELINKDKGAVVLSIDDLKE